MKPFEYYSTIKTKYPDRTKHVAELRQLIDNQKLTAKEREVAYLNIPADATKWFKEAVKPYSEEGIRLHNEFIADCRAKLEYGQLLNNTGCEAVECLAWEMGHSCGYSEVYNYTGQLSELAVNICKSIKETLD